jgi:hypothetical protein
VKGAEGKRDERLAVAAAVAGGRRRSSIAGDGKGRRRLSQLFSRLWLSLGMEIEIGNLHKDPCNLGVFVFVQLHSTAVIVSEMPINTPKLSEFCD